MLCCDLCSCTALGNPNTNTHDSANAYHRSGYHSHNDHRGVVLLLGRKHVAFIGFDRPADCAGTGLLALGTGGRCKHLYPIAKGMRGLSGHAARVTIGIACIAVNVSGCKLTVSNAADLTDRLVLAVCLAARMDTVSTAVLAFAVYKGVCLIGNAHAAAIVSLEVSA